MSEGDVTPTRDHGIRLLGRVAGLLYRVIIACGIGSAAKPTCTFVISI